ncbi:hypothetical protein NQD34_004806 [Periophthalmus magnuspinnatus]|nr:hypothetical protein NQD34_004806 [Periophthalmus magnuspinnatus]
MLERFLSQQQAISATLAGERGAWHLMPKETDLSVMGQVCELLGPLSQFTDALSTETSVTLSTLKPVLEHIKTEILIQSNDDPPLITQMKKTMREDLDSRYSEKALKMMDIACFIDPRFKGNFSENRVDIVSITVQEALRLVPVNVRQEPPAEMTSRPISTSTLDKASTHGLTGLLKKITATRQQRTEEQSTIEDQVKAEVKIYMCLPSVETEEDPLLWWGGHAGELPHLSRIARRFLCIPATSVPSERIFSASGSIVTPHRARLNPEKVNMLTFLHFNLP